MIVGSRSRRNKPKRKKRLDVPGHKVMEHVNDRFAAAVDNRNYYLLKELFWYDDDVLHELYQLAKKIPVKMSDYDFFGKTRCW